MTYVVLIRLEERKPMWYYTLAAALFIISQLAWFLLGRVICNVRFCLSISWVMFIFFGSQGSKQKVDGSFIATILETASVVAIYLGWQSITEGALRFQATRLTDFRFLRLLGSWEDPQYPM
jgi:Chitin synthase export chaperone